MMLGSFDFRVDSRDSVEINVMSILICVIVDKTLFLSSVRMFLCITCVSFSVFVFLCFILSMCVIYI